MKLPYLNNTDGGEDTAIRAATDEDHIEVLVGIIKRLDNVIEDWKRAASKADCDDPDDLAKFISTIEST